MKYSLSYGDRMISIEPILETESIKHKFNFIMVPLGRIDCEGYRAGYFYTDWLKTVDPNGEAA